MKISLTEKRVKKIVEGLSKHKFVYAIDKDHDRVMFTCDGTILYYSDIYPGLIEFLSEYNSCERDFDTINKMFITYRNKAFDNKSIDYYSYDQLSKLPRIKWYDDRLSRDVSCIQFSKKHIVKASFFEGLSNKKFRYEQIPISDQVSMIYVYSIVDESITAIIFGLRGKYYGINR